MTKMTQSALRYDWERDIVPYLENMQSVEGGFTPAKRGVVELADGNTVFVKIATGEMTQKWLEKEIKVYQKLNKAGYPFIPQLLACAGNHEAMAIEYLDGANFENNWDKNKLDSVVRAQEALKKYSDIFANDTDFKTDNMFDLDLKWPSILKSYNLKTVNKRLVKLGADITFSHEQIKEFQRIQEGWFFKGDTLIHTDIRADNFGYDPNTKEGKLIDWNWLCIGDESLDTTSLFVNVYLSGLNPYKFHPEKYDSKMLAHLAGYWLDSILTSDENPDAREFKLRAAQAKNVKACMELLTN